MQIRPLAIGVLLVFTVSTFSYAGDPPKTEWFRFTLSKNLDPGSPADMETLFLDAPAGKHGFVKMKDDSFIFEDGTPAKFWGTNLGSYVTFPSKEEAESLTKQLAFLGFNAVRLHHMDLYDEPGGIFVPKTSKLSDNQLDRLDYLVAQLKNHGIYVDINLLVARDFKNSEGIVAAKRLGMAAKPVSLFDRKLIELQKDYARDLLAHKNKYTGLRYCDDPAVALVEITNENSIFQYWQWGNLNGPLLGLKKGTIPAYYVQELDTLWNAWLKNKYKTAGPLHFKRPMYQSIGLDTERQKKDVVDFYIELEKNYFDEMTAFLKNELGVKVPVTGLGGYSHKNDLRALSQSDFIDTHTYWDHPEFPHGWNRYDFKMHKKSLLEDDPKGFIGAIASSRVEGKPATVTEWNDCYPNPYAYEMPLFIAAQSVQNNWPAVFQFAWSQGPKFELHPGNIISFFHIAQNAQQSLLCLAASALFYNADNLKTDIKNGVMTLESLNFKSAAGFIKNKDFRFGKLMVHSYEDGAVALFSADKKPFETSDRLILMTVSEIKNRDSRWDGDRFYWGGPWSLLKKMPVKILMETKKPFKIYELNENGKRGKEIQSNWKNEELSFSTELSETPWFEIAQ